MVKIIYLKISQQSSFALLDVSHTTFYKKYEKIKFEIPYFYIRKKKIAKCLQIQSIAHIIIKETEIKLLEGHRSKL